MPVLMEEGGGILVKIVGGILVNCVLLLYIGRNVVVWENYCGISFWKSKRSKSPLQSQFRKISIEKASEQPLR